jgi:hypothetical protein
MIHQGDLKMRKVLYLLALAFLFRLPASAQDLSRVDLFAGASFLHVTGPSEPSLKVYGGVFSGAYNVNHFISWTGEFGIQSNAGPTGGRAESYMFGPKVALTLHKTGRFLPFAQWIFGAMHTSAAFNGTPFNSTDFAESAGVGLDVSVTRHLAIRPVEADYLFMKQPIYDPSTGTNDATFTEKSFRYSGGIVFRF